MLPGGAGNRRFRPLGALRAHKKAPYKMEFHRKTLRALNHPWAARTDAELREGLEREHGVRVLVRIRDGSAQRHLGTHAPQCRVGIRGTKYVQLVTVVIS